jgi:cell division protein FtsI/penicillin-binding protein 2
MKKNIVKLSLKDIENIVERTINESMNEDDSLEGVSSDRNIMIAKDENGKIYVMDVETGDILGTK